MATPQTLRRLAYFAEAARAGSISGGAARLRLSPAVVSEALSELEAAMGVVLARRTTRSFTLTDHGAAVLAHAEAALAAADAAVAVGVEAQAARGVVRVTAPAEIAAFWLPRRLAAFQAAHPGVTVELDADDRFKALAGGPIEVAISARYEPEKPPRRQDRIALLPLALVAAPDVLAAGPADEDLAAKLERIGLISPRSLDDRAGDVQAVRRRDGAPVTLRAPLRAAVNNQTVGAELAREGFGAVLVIEAAVAADLRSGRLAPVDAGHAFGFVSLRLRLRDRLPTGAAAALRDYLAAHATDIDEAGETNQG